MNARAIFVVDPGARVPEIDCFNRIAQDSSLPCHYHLPALFGLDSLDDEPQHPSGIIILGSGASVYDKLLWQDRLMSWLQPKMESGIPTLGICYGHQLIAHIFGSRVTTLYSDSRKLVGHRNVKIGSNKLGLTQKTYHLVVSHREVVNEIPKGFQAFASSQEVPLDGFEHLELPTWTLQPHPEAHDGFLRNQSIKIAEKHKPEVFASGAEIISQFLKFCARQGA